jgi:hypothetical protein
MIIFISLVIICNFTLIWYLIRTKSGRPYKRDWFLEAFLIPLTSVFFAAQAYRLIGLFIGCDG